MPVGVRAAVLRLFQACRSNRIHTCRAKKAPIWPAAGIPLARRMESAACINEAESVSSWVPTRAPSCERVRMLLKVSRTGLWCPREIVRYMAMADVPFSMRYAPCADLKSVPERFHIRAAFFAGFAKCCAQRICNLLRCTALWYKYPSAAV